MAPALPWASRGPRLCRLRPRKQCSGCPSVPGPLREAPAWLSSQSRRRARSLLRTLFGTFNSSRLFSRRRSALPAARLGLGKGAGRRRGAGGGGPAGPSPLFAVPAGSMSVGGSAATAGARPRAPRGASNVSNCMGRGLWGRRCRQCRGDLWGPRCHLARRWMLTSAVGEEAPAELQIPPAPC